MKCRYPLHACNKNEKDKSKKRKRMTKFFREANVLCCAL